MPKTWLLAIVAIFAALIYGLLVWQRKRLEGAHEFLGEAKAELKKVTWPSRMEVRNTTIIVIVTVFFFGTYLSLIDFVVTAARQALYSAVGAGGL